MHHMQQIVNAAIAECDSRQTKSIPGPGLNLGPFCIESRHSTTELLRNTIPGMTIQLYHTACKAALIKRLFSAALIHSIIQLL